MLISRTLPLCPPRVVLLIGRGERTPHAASWGGAEPFEGGITAGHEGSDSFLSWWGRSLRVTGQLLRAPTNRLVTDGFLVMASLAGDGNLWQRSLREISGPLGIWSQKLNLHPGPSLHSCEILSLHKATAIEPSWPRTGTLICEAK